MVRLSFSPVRALALVAGMALISVPHIAAADTLSQKAKVAARACLVAVESNQVDVAYLAKNGYAPKNARNKDFVKYEMREAFGANGKSLGQRKVMMGKIRVEMRPNRPGKHGTYCSFEAGGQADPKKPKGPSAVETAAAKAFVGVAQARGYKIQLVKKKSGMGYGHNKYLVKGDVRLILGDSVSAKGLRMVRLSLQRTNR